MREQTNEIRRQVGTPTLTPLRQPSGQQALVPDPLAEVTAQGGTPLAAHAEALRAATGGQLAYGAASLHRLQQEYGNGYTQQVVAGARAEATPSAPVVQPKLLLGPSSDPYEQEAEQVAHQVGQGQRAVAPLTLRRPQGSPEAVTPAVEAEIRTARGAGQPLASALRTTMEQSLGADFGAVRVHTDARAHHLNEALQARAFTTGSDIFFRRDGYAPTSEAGRTLLAHELTHVVQQGSALPIPAAPSQGEATSASTGGPAVVQRALKAQLSKKMTYTQQRSTNFFNDVQSNLKQLTGNNALTFTFNNQQRFKRILTVGLGEADKVAQAMETHPKGMRLVRRMIESNRTTTIKDTTGMTPNPAQSAKPVGRGNAIARMRRAAGGGGSDAKVYWNARMADEMTLAPIFNSATNQYEKMPTPSHITLGHEMGHADRINRGVSAYDVTDQGIRTKVGGIVRGANTKLYPTQSSPLELEEIYNIGLQGTDIENMEIQTPENPDTETITENDLRDEQQLQRRVGYIPLASDKAYTPPDDDDS